MTAIGDIHALAVIGLGRSGTAAGVLARDRLPGVPVTVVDAKDEAELGAALPPSVDLVVKSPGVPNESPFVREALSRGLPIWSEVEFAARFLRNRWIAITGTNGKTTTTELTGAILRDAGMPVEVAGNVGRALAGLPDAIDPAAVIVAELSSFQLEHVEAFRPDVAVLLNLTEDHLDRHGDFAGYVAAKLRIFENQTPDDLAVLNLDDPPTAGLAVPGSPRIGYFSLGGEGDDLVAGLGYGRAGTCEPGVARPLWVQVGEKREPLCSASELSLRGEHNIANCLAAAAAAAAVDVPPASIAQTLRTFEGVPHRLQVAGVAGGVTWVNDSKATNVDAALKALTAYSGPVYMILGGSLKGASFDELARATEGRIKEAILIGVAAKALRESFQRRRAAVGHKATPYVVLPDMAAAVDYAAAHAVPGDVVLLSPACASFDQYRNFEHRGEHFIELVTSLREQTTG